jgi:hypothetical protein
LGWLPFFSTRFTILASDAKLLLAAKESSPHRETMAGSDKLFTPREAAQVPGIGCPTLKQGFCRNKIRTIHTVGGHHRIPVSRMDAFLYNASEGRKVAQGRSGFCYGYQTATHNAIFPLRLLF